MTAPALTRRTILGGSLATAGLTLASPAIAGAATSSGWPSISGAANSNDVRAVQYLLLAAGSQFRTSWGNTYDPNTRAMVMAFQRSRRLPVTGRADPTTLVALTGTLSRGTTSYRTYAAQTLLNKHGYGQALATTYNTQTDRNIRGFQAGRRLVQSSTIGASTWAALFGRVTTRPNVALMQYQTGAAQWSNCGPAAAVSLLLNRRITPAGWDGNAANRAVAVANFRYSAMGVANTSARNPHGTEFPDFQPAFAKYGLSAWHGGISDTITEAHLAEAVTYRPRELSS